MESGGKAVIKKISQEDYSSALLGITCHIIVCNIKLAPRMCFEDYKYKMNLMTEIAAKEEFFRAGCCFRNCLRIRILKLTNRKAIIGAIWIWGIKECILF